MIGIVEKPCSNAAAMSSCRLFAVGRNPGKSFTTYIVSPAKGVCGVNGVCRFADGHAGHTHHA